MDKEKLRIVRETVALLKKKGLFKEETEMQQITAMNDRKKLIKTILSNSKNTLPEEKLKTFSAIKLRTYLATLKESTELKESYMGNPGDEVEIHPQRDEFVLISKDGLKQVNMFFSSPEEAKKYIDKKGLVLVNNNNLSEATTEGEKNLLVKNLQTCVSDIEEAKGYIEMLLATTLDRQEENMLSNAIDKLELVIKVLNEQIGSETKDEGLTEDLEMTLDQVTKNPQDIQKLKDKKLDVRVIDDSNPNM